MFSKQLGSDEKIVVVIRKHWLVFILEAFVIVLAIVAPLIAAVFVPSSLLVSLAQIGVSGDLLLFAYVIFVLVLWMFLFILWTTYFLDAWVVTNRRVIDIDQKTLFYRETTTLMLEKIQDVTVEVQGILATLFGYGKLTLHTAGDGEDIVINFAAHPQYAKDRIIACQDLARHMGKKDSI